MIQLFGSGAVIIAIAFLTPIMLIFGEIVPKSIFQQHADKTALRIIKPLAIFRALVLPVVIVFSWTAKTIAKKFGPSGSIVSPYATRQRLRTMLCSADKPADITVDRARIMQAILLPDMTVGEVMSPLAQVLGAEVTASTREVLKLGRDFGHRRIPIYEGNLSNITAIAN
jgi:CBS domain containing-hemolysin-like protein